MLLAVLFVTGTITVYMWVLWYRHQDREEKSLQMVCIQIAVPRDNEIKIDAMEQIFSALHAAEKAIISCELVGSAGESRFYFRLPKQYVNLIEAALYAQYPEAEISVIPPEKDYLSLVPNKLPNNVYDIYGGELILKNANPYPIRTYPMFEESVEERRIDPVSGIMESMSRLKNDEHLWLQILISPLDKDGETAWQKESEETVDKLNGKKKPASSSTPLFGVTLPEIIKAPFVHPGLEVKKSDEKEKKDTPTPGKKNIIEGVEDKMAKLGFGVTIRFLYIDRKNVFARDNVVSILGAFRQFNTQNMNAFDVDKNTVTALKMKKALFKEQKKPWFYDLQLHSRKMMLYNAYRKAAPRGKPFVLNTEELATIYHFPVIGVITPSLPRVEARRGSAPPNLPTL